MTPEEIYDQSRDKLLATLPPIPEVTIPIPKPNLVELAVKLPPAIKTKVMPESRPCCPYCGKKVGLC